MRDKRRWLSVLSGGISLTLTLSTADVHAASSLLVSKSANRSSPSTLSGQALNGTIYAYTNSTSPVKSVQFYLDGVLKTTESVAPYDLAGSVSATQAKPFDTNQIATGGHTITAKVLLATGVTETATGSFTRSAPVVSNPTGGGPISGGSGKKYHPGHYILAYEGAGVGKLSQIANDPYFLGIKALHDWRELEKTKGGYSFAVLAGELNSAKAVNKRYLVKIMDKAFSSKRTPCVPDYMLTDPIYKGGQTVGYNTDGSVRFCAAKRWVPAVQNRLNALYAAMGKQFDAEPYFEGVETTENSLPTWGTNASDYTLQGHTNGVMSGMTALAAAFPRSQVFASVNWTAKELAQLIPHAYNIGIGIGGPDLVPPVAGELTTYSYAYYPRYYGKMPLSIDVQGAVNKHLSSGLFDFEDLYAFAITDPQGLRVNYIFWTITDRTYVPYLSFTNLLKPMVDRHQGYINRGCPLNITCQ